MKKKNYWFGFYTSILPIIVVLWIVLSESGVYKYKVIDGDGQKSSLKAYKGKVLLIVNTATQCGFTPQYEALEATYQKYKARGLEVLDFPCNQFNGQAPGSYEEIHQFCTTRYHISFPQFEKVDVNGENTSKLYRYLKREQPFKGFDLNNSTGRRMHEMLLKKDAHYAENNEIKWNFTKFLVNRKGKVVARFEPYVGMDIVEKEIERLLDEQTDRQ